MVNLVLDSQLSELYTIYTNLAQDFSYNISIKKSHFSCQFKILQGLLWRSQEQFIKRAKNAFEKTGTSFFSKEKLRNFILRNGYHLWKQKHLMPKF